MCWFVGRTPSPPHQGRRSPAVKRGEEESPTTAQRRQTWALFCSSPPYKSKGRGLGESHVYAVGSGGGRRQRREEKRSHRPLPNAARPARCSAPVHRTNQREEEEGNRTSTPLVRRIDSIDAAPREEVAGREGRRRAFTGHCPTPPDLLAALLQFGEATATPEVCYQFHSVVRHRQTTHKSSKSIHCLSA
nr:hypothetical protein Iba_chr15bCG1110 [Ipomoea batatas]